MADEIKVVNGTQLDAALELIGNAIRAKGETTERFPSAKAMAAAIEAIQAGGGGIEAAVGSIKLASNAEQLQLTHTLTSAPNFCLVWCDSSYSEEDNQEMCLIWYSRNGKKYIDMVAKSKYDAWSYRTKWQYNYETDCVTTSGNTTTVMAVKDHKYQEQLHFKAGTPIRWLLAVLSDDFNQ